MTPIQFMKWIGIGKLEKSKREGRVDEYMQWSGENPGKKICLSCRYHGEEVQDEETDSCPKCQAYLLMRTVGDIDAERHTSRPKPTVLWMRPGAA